MLTQRKREWVQELINTYIYIYSYITMTAPMASLRSLKHLLTHPLAFLPGCGNIIILNWGTVHCTCM